MKTGFENNKNKEIQELWWRDSLKKKNLRKEEQTKLDKNII